MSGWPTRPTRRLRGRSSRARRPVTSESAYWDGDVWWATPKDLSELKGAYISSTPRKITRSGLQSLCSNDTAA